MFQDINMEAAKCHLSTHLSISFSLQQRICMSFIFTIHYLSHYKPPAVVFTDSPLTVNHATVRGIGKVILTLHFKKKKKKSFQNSGGKEKYYRVPLKIFLSLNSVSSPPPPHKLLFLLWLPDKILYVSGSDFIFKMVLSKI